MYPWRRILIPTDFSTASEWSYDTAVGVAGSTGAELFILHVRSTWTSQPDKLRFPADDTLYSYVEQHELEKVRDHVRRANAKIPTRLLVRKAPNAGEEIGRAAEKVDVVIGVGPLARAYEPDAWAADAAEAVAVARELVRPGDAVLVKASRSVGLEVVAEALAGVSAP